MPSRIASPAVTDFTEDALALLRSLHRDYDFWIIKKVGAKGIRGARSAILTGRSSTRTHPKSWSKRCAGYGPASVAYGRPPDGRPALLPGVVSCLLTCGDVQLTHASIMFRMIMSWTPSMMASAIPGRP